MIARSTAGLSSARTIASSLAVSTASSIPAASATRPPARAPMPEQPRRQRRATARSWLSPLGCHLQSSWSPSRRSEPLRCDDGGMRTAIVSDLHLGLGSGADLLRRARFRELLLGALEGADRVVLLGDVLELRDRPLAEVLATAAPVLAALGEAIAGRELLIVPGNHDHHLIEPWLGRRASRRCRPARARATRRARGPRLRDAGRPGAGRERSLRLSGRLASRRRLRDPRPLPGPSSDRADGRATRCRGGRADPRGSQRRARPAGPARRRGGSRHRRVRTRADARLHIPVRACAGDRRRPPWRPLSLGADLGDARRRATVAGRGCAAGCWARWRSRAPSEWPTASASGRCAATSRPGRSPEPASRRWPRSASCSRSEAEHVIFGHTHHRGSPAGSGAIKLHNTGSWVHQQSLIGRRASESPYWPGTICFVDDEGRARARPPAR